jgi:hypothetical protein
MAACPDRILVPFMAVRIGRGAVMDASAPQFNVGEAAFHPVWDKVEVLALDADRIAVRLADGTEKNTRPSYLRREPFRKGMRRIEPNRPSAPKSRGGRTAIRAEIFEWRDPSTIPARDFLYGSHYSREFVSGTAAPGGTGKSAASVAEAVAMVSGRPILGTNPKRPLNVWMWNLEDPREEVERRFAAAVLHHGIDPRNMPGKLYVNSGRDTPLVIGTKFRDHVVIAQPVVDALVAEIEALAIDVLVIDPFISSHGVPENDNGAIDAIVKEWGRIAGRGRCAVELVHHTKKMNGEGMSEESFRGAKSLVDGLRSGRVLHRMSETDAGNLGVSAEYRRYFYTMPEKQSMAPPASERTWYRLASVEIGNGDNVAAVELWKPPNPFDGITAMHLEKVQSMFRSGTWRQSDQANDWGGYAVATVLELDAGAGLRAAQRNPTQKAVRGKIKQILRTWEMNGAIATETRQDPSRRVEKSFYCVPDEEGNDGE